MVSSSNCEVSLAADFKQIERAWEGGEVYGRMEPGVEIDMGFPEGEPLGGKKERKKGGEWEISKYGQ